MSQVVSMRFKDNQMERLKRLARRLGKTPSETSALLVEEALRQAEFAQIDFRDSGVGRQAHLKGSTLAVWEVINIARGFQMDLDKTADYLNWPSHRVQAAFSYATAFPAEIEHAIQDHDAVDFEALSKKLPGIMYFEVDDSVLAEGAMSEDEFSA